MNGTVPIISITNDLSGRFSFVITVNRTASARSDDKRRNNMEESVKNKLKSGFTIARWGIDICLGALFIAIALIISALTKDGTNLIKMLMIPLVLCVVGLIVFAAGRVMVGLQSRKLNLHTDRPLTEEERWFVGCMMEMEEKGAGVNFFNSVTRATSGSGDDIVAGAVATAVVGSFFKTGKKYMGHNFLLNRLPAIVSLVIAIVIAVMAIV